MATLPLLVFPQARVLTPPKVKGYGLTKAHFPGHEAQVARLSPQLEDLTKEFTRFRASVSGDLRNMEPETVLVIEIAGAVEDFKQAVDATDGLEWLGEWDIEDIVPDELFYNLDSKGKKTAKPLTGRLYISMGNERGIQELLALWEKWSKDEGLPKGRTKWRDVFAQTRNIRRWGIQETLVETGMVERWRDLLQPLNPSLSIRCQIELFYRVSHAKRTENENRVRALLVEIGGTAISRFLEMPTIRFHAVKAELPAEQVRHLLDWVNRPETDLDIQLFNFPGIMYFRSTGQSIAVSEAETGEPCDFPADVPGLEPVAAILDGVPNVRHEGLKHHLVFDDPDNLAAEYQPGERGHGTSMASLVIHGELDGRNTPLARKVYHCAVMQPNAEDPHKPRAEHCPDAVFMEDRIERAVRRMFEGAGDSPPQAADVKVINLSIGDRERPFIHSPSPWARLLDWLSWKYRVLFLVSAGNCADDIDLGISEDEFAACSDEDKVKHTWRCIARQLSQRRLLSPAESLNALTIGALHADMSTISSLGYRVDLFPNNSLFSPAARFGHGFRRSIKPEVWFPGGRQFYERRFGSSRYRVDQFKQAPGQKVAWDSTQPGNTSTSVYTRGTSNATALATRSGIRIYDALRQLQTSDGSPIPDDLMAVLIKTLLVHGTQQPELAKGYFAEALEDPPNSRRVNSREAVTRYVGYGAMNIERVLACTEQRGTVVGCGEIGENEIHEYCFPLPIALAGSKDWRRMLVTLAWFTPINPSHRNLREARLKLSPDVKWDEQPLGLCRRDTDHNQVLRGTVQHEVLTGERQIAAFRDGDNILLRVTCNADATERLDQAIPYGLAVTLEVAEGVDIPIYQQIRDRIRPRVAIGTRVEDF